MLALAKHALAVVAAFSGDEEGLLKVERALLNGVIVFTVVAVLFLLGTDIAEWFGIEPPVEEDT